MSDVIISRRGSSSGSSKGRLITEYITFNTEWEVPNGVVDNKFDVRIFGGGGKHWEDDHNGGCSGFMNNDILDLTPGSLISIIVGGPATVNGGSGGTTSFGTMLSAGGGNVSYGGSGGYFYYGSGGNAAQFGGGGGNYGGNGGVWGGGGGGYNEGGNGGLYGGGGGCGIGGSNSTKVLRMRGGDGGKYGGGGGSGISLSYVAAPAGNGGEYGGVGGRGGEYWMYANCSNRPATRAGNGTNTVGLDSVPIDLQGYGLAGLWKNVIPVYVDADYTYWWSPAGSGGGGYGGNGGGGVVEGGGGGGYGGNGEDMMKYNLTHNGILKYHYPNCLGGTIDCGGGGGGYGGDGNQYGGGGYGKQSIGRAGGGGGYYCPGGGINNTGGGGGIGIWVGNKLVASFGSGGKASDTKKLPEPGICIIQYYLK